MITTREMERADAALGPSALERPELERARAIRTLAAALGEAMESHLLYGRIRGDTLEWVFDHPAMVGEFAMHREEILERMRQIYREKKLKDLLVFRRVTARSEARPPRQSPRPQSRREVATGSFEIQVNSPALRGVFERIREHIKAAREGGDDV